MQSLATNDGGEKQSSVKASPLTLQSKILSLEFLLSILEHSGPSFRASDKFIFAIRQYVPHNDITILYPIPAYKRFLLSP